MTAADTPDATQADDGRGVADMVKVLQHRARHGRHLHHRDCIHNLPPDEQVLLRGKTVDWWMAYIGHMPAQITPDQWECEPPIGDTP